MSLTKKTILAICATVLLGTFGNAAETFAEPMHHVNRFSGEEKLRFTAGGRALAPEGARLSYRLIHNETGWSRIWGPLYDNLLAVDFSQHRVLAIYRSPANGVFSLRPTMVELSDDRLRVHVEVTWNGRSEPSHPFLFLVVPPFEHLFVEETFHGPSGRDIRYP